MKHHSILFVGALLAIIQIVGGAIMYQHAQVSLPVLTVGQAEHVFGLLRQNRDIRSVSSEDKAEWLNEWVNAHHDDGLRALTIYQRTGSLIATTDHTLPVAPENRGKIIPYKTNHILYTMPPIRHSPKERRRRRRRRRADKPPHHRPPHHRPPHHRPPHHRPPHHRPPPPDVKNAPPVMVMHIEPTMANTMARRGNFTLGGSLLSALLTILGTLALSRMMRKHIAAQEQAAQDKHLRVLGEMSAVIAHELKNPLTSAKGNAQLLAEFREEDESWKLKKLEHIVQDLGTIEYRTENLLRFVRSGQINLAHAPMTSLTARLNVLHRRLNQDRIHLDLKTQDNEIYMDLDAIEEVLGNLLTNALDASSQTVVLRVISKPHCLRFEVQDTGAGLPDGMDVFEPFNTSKVDGTGLGLAISRRLVEAHGSQLMVDSIKNEGTTFFFELKTSS